MRHKFNVGDKVKFKDDRPGVEPCEVVKWRRVNFKDELYLVKTAEGIIIDARKDELELVE